MSGTSAIFIAEDRPWSDVHSGVGFLLQQSAYRKSDVRRLNPRNRLVLRASSSEATDLSMTDLQLMLEDAIRQEDYQEAARLRDVLT